MNGITLANVVARVESGGSLGQWAQRFEPLQFGVARPGLLALVAEVNKCSLKTADVYAATSHGAFQLMGFRLYGDPRQDKRNVGYQGTLWGFLSDLKTQEYYFGVYCTQNNIAFTPDDLCHHPDELAAFASCYNGPGNVPEYSKRVLNAIAELQMHAA